jgi:endonuclease/exonuclease/phosphatase family metal-dependent hydrolase
MARLRNANGVDFAVTVLHLPVKKQQSRADIAQCADFFASYESVARRELGLAFTTRGAIEARQKLAAHIVGGDFNRPAALTRSSGFVEPAEGMITTGGMQACDGFVLNGNASHVFRFWVRAWRLARYASRNQGQAVSDHAPVVLELARK